MSRKKGLSLEDKRTAMLEIFHESADVFQVHVVAAHALACCPPQGRRLSIVSAAAVERHRKAVCEERHSAPDGEGCAAVSYRR